MSRMLKLLAVIGCLGMGAFIPQEAAADGPYAYVCNKPPSPNSGQRLSNDIWFTIGYWTKSKSWISSGWWHLRPGDCEQVGPFTSRSKRVYYSVMEHNPSTGKTFTWPGDSSHCTRDGDNFQGVRNTRPCPPGYERSPSFTEYSPQPGSGRLHWIKRGYPRNNTIGTYFYRR